jgi:hypothetical protein
MIHRCFREDPAMSASPTPSTPIITERLAQFEVAAHQYRTEIRDLMSGLQSDAPLVAFFLGEIDRSVRVSRAIWRTGSPPEPTAA